MYRHTYTARGLLGPLLTTLLLACASQPPQNETDDFTTVLLVRHAEKELTGDDPGLTEYGVARAAALAHVAGELGVSAVYSTHYLRTRATAQPLASLLGLEVNEITATPSYPAEMAEIIRSQHSGEAVVVVGHSNTVPTMIGELGVSPIPSIEDDEYDNLYVVVLAPKGDAHLISLRYGRETP